VVGAGRILDHGPIDQVRGSGDLEERFVDLVGGPGHERELSWLRHS